MEPDLSTALGFEVHAGKFGQSFREGEWVMHVGRQGSNITYQVGRIESFKSKNVDIVRWSLVAGTRERVVYERPPEVKACVKFFEGYGNYTSYPRAAWVLLDHLIVVDPHSLKAEIVMKWRDSV
jgi:hypothetical protein